jgi:hypothetical protein
MVKRKYTVEEIVTVLRQVEAVIGNGKTTLADASPCVAGPRVCGELLILAENTSGAQSCESFTYR